MKIAITGGRGRIGGAIGARALTQGHSIVSIDRVPITEDDAPGMTSVMFDMDNYDALVQALEGCDALVHMAAIPSPGRQPDHVVHNNNVVGSYNALRAAAEHGILRVCQASSVNAIGSAYSRWPRYDYFPIDEQHPTYNEDPYSLSKRICELQGDSFARRYDGMTIASMRFHWVVENREFAAEHQKFMGDGLAKHLWAYTRMDTAAEACLLSLSAPFQGHEVFFITASDSMMDTPSRELAAKHFPDVPIRGSFEGRASFFDSSKAERLLGWKHGLGDSGQ